MGVRGAEGGAVRGAKKKLKTKSGNNSKTAYCV